MRGYRLILPAVALFLASGCGILGIGGNRDKVVCDDFQEYQKSRNDPAIRVPGDLDRPDEEQGLRIPPGPVASGRPPPDNPCLARPPDYFEDDAVPSSGPSEG